MAKWQKVLRQQSGEAFWASVSASVVSGVITAWVIFTVASTVGIAALGSAGRPLELAEAIACFVLCLLLGASFWSCVLYLGVSLRVWRKTQPGWDMAWIVLDASLALAGCGWVNAPLATFAVVALPFVVGAVAQIVVTGSGSRKRTRWRKTVWSSIAVLGAVAFVTNGIAIGSIISRALAMSHS